MDGPTLADMARDTPAGLCPLCWDALPPRVTKPPRYCGAPECKTAYQRLYRRAYRDPSGVELLASAGVTPVLYDKWEKAWR